MRTVAESNAYKAVKSNPFATEITFEFGVIVTVEELSAPLPLTVADAEYTKVTVVVSPFAITFPLKVADRPDTVGFRVVTVGAALEVVKLKIAPGVNPRALSPIAWK